MKVLAVKAAYGAERWNRMMTRVSCIDDDTGLERQSFRDGKLELFVWSGKGVIKGFELHYAIHTEDEWSLRWTDDGQTSFQGVDPHRVIEGRNDGCVMQPLNRNAVAVHDLYAEFLVRSRTIDERVRRLVLRTLSAVIRRG